MPKGKGTYGSKVGRPPKKKMNMGGMMSPTKKKPTGSATGLSGMKGGGMMRKKGYAMGGMKDDYAIGGDMTKQPIKKKRMAKGGAARRGR